VFVTQEYAFDLGSCLEGEVRLLDIYDYEEHPKY